MSINDEWNFRWPPRSSSPASTVGATVGNRPPGRPGYYRGLREEQEKIRRAQLYMARETTPS